MNFLIYVVGLNLKGYRMLFVICFFVGVDVGIGRYIVDGIILVCFLELGRVKRGEVVGRVGYIGFDEIRGELDGVFGWVGLDYF